MITSSVLFLAIAMTSQQSVDPVKLVGMWEVVKGKQPPVGSTLEFTKDGKFKATIKGQPFTFEGDYKLEGDQLTLTPPGSAMSVKELTKDKLVVEGGGNSMEYKRTEAVAAAMPKATQKTGGFSLGTKPKSTGKLAVVKSKAGDFTVEMPGQPNGWQDGSEGEFETHGMSHQTRSLEFIANTIEGPTEVPQADEAKTIDGLRDKAISRYGKDAKLVYEKEVRAGDLTGREFEVKFDRMGAGPAVARGRVYIKGKKSYVLLVMPIVKNQELPPEAGKFLESFALTDKPAPSIPNDTATAKGNPIPKAIPGNGEFTVSATPKSAGKWVLVKSLVDSFMVEMPGPPNGKGGWPNLGFESHGLRHQTRTTEYIVLTIYRATDAPKSEYVRALSDIRDKVVAKYGIDIKVVSEKAVKLGAIPGQEFDVTLDRSGAGPVMARGRVFLDNGLAYALLVMPVVKTAEVPPDATKFLDSFALTGSTGEVVAESRPREKAAAKANTRKTAGRVKGWGTEVDPDGDVKITASAQSLTIQIPGTPHVLAPERDKMNAPRVLAPAPDDFVVTVKVDGAFQPSDKSTLKGLSSRQTGGLILWKDAKNYLVFQRRAAVGDEGKDTNQAVLEELVVGAKGVTHRQAIPEGATFLRLERKGGRITASWSGDDTSWKDLKPVDTTWASGEVQVGVIAVNTSTGPHKVTFENYSLKEK